MKVAALLLLMSTVLCVQLESGVPILLKEIRALKSDNSDFKNLLDLELSQGAKLDEVVLLIGDLLTQQKQDQLQDDLDYAHRITTINLDIEYLQIILGSLQREKVAKNQQWEEVTQLIAQLNGVLDNLRTQLEILNGKEEEVRNIRAQEAASYQHRTENNNKVLEALNNILPKLSSAVFNAQGALIEIDRDQMVESIRKELGYNNPIAVLIAMTAKFDVPTVKRIIEKLEYIRQSVIEGQQVEDEREVAAIQAFQTTIQQLAELREKFQKDFQVVSTQLQKANNTRILLEKRLAVLAKDLTNTNLILEQTKEYRDQYEASYQQRKGKRINEIKTVQAAYDLVDKYAKKK
ncbi:hypothetical protein pb186bvf_002757 [Paramecium bursaria]